jgi:dipeptidyl aminopeptidase/acylaminoacyl peptidase
MRHPTLLLAALLPLLASAAPTTVPGAAPLPGQPNVVVSGVPEVPAALAERMGQYLETRRVTLLDVSRDGRQVLVTTRFAESAQLHLVEQPLGARTQLTFGREPIRDARFHPGDAKTLFFLRDVGGAEFFQLYRLDRRSGRAQLLTDGKSRHEALVVSHDGGQLAYAGTGRTGKDSDVYVASTSEPAKARRVTEEAGTWYPLDFSRDGKRLLLQQFRAIDDSDLHVVDLATGERRQLSPKEGKGSVVAARFSADGRQALVVTDRFSDFAELYRVELQPAPGTPASASLTRGVKWDVEGFDVSEDGRTVVASFNEDGVSRLRRIDLASGKMTPVALPDGVVGAVHFFGKAGDKAAVQLGTGTAPADVWVVGLTGVGKPVRWTASEMGGLDEAQLVTPELVRYPSADGVQVPAFLYKAKGVKGKAPVMMLYHGGPEGQTRPVFSPLTQYLASELGVSVIAPNVRGSDGYGKAYRAMDDGVKREQSLKDIGATLDFIASRPDLDASRVGVQGGSYGGYMTLAAAAFYPERIKAAVDVVGISSLATFLQNTQAYRRDLRRAEYGDERDPAVRAVQDRISPLGSVDRIRASLFVLQGANDPRVPQSEAEQIVKAVRGKGRDAWYLLALDEGHGFAKKPNIDLAAMTTVMFLQKHLLGTAPTN